MSLLEATSSALQNEGVSVPVEPALAAALTRVDRLDFTNVKNKLMVKDGWGEDLCEQVEGLYRKFLALQMCYPEGTLVPTPSIDDFWHRHILDTRAYQRDCQALFGEFLHHEPSTGTPEERRAMDAGLAATVELYRSQFGVDPRITDRDFEMVGHCGCHRCSCRCG